jgi:tetratricopeptide (TPR) repeat protein
MDNKVKARKRSNTGTILGSGVYESLEDAKKRAAEAQLTPSASAPPPSRDRRSETTPPFGFGVRDPSDSAPGARSSRPAASDSSRVGMIIDATSDSGARMRQPWVREALKVEAAESLALAPGKMIPGTRYKVLRWLGDGSMGVVYAAEHVDIGRKVAVKVLRGTSGPNAAVHAFRQEARLASQVGSDHIVQVLDFAELPNGRLMFVMEFVDGRPLNRELRRGKLSVARTIGILRQVAKGLGAAHDAKVIHRDVKPDNIMLEAHPRPDRARLLDFGVASISKTVERKAGDLVGTPFYVAPEILSGETYDEHVDLYSLGCTAYEMLCGEPPFNYSTVELLLNAHIFETPKPLHEVDSTVPRQISDVVMRCLHKRPEQRYANLDEFEAALIEAQIACGEITSWDDLPLPNVDPERRVKLMEGLNPSEPAASRAPLFALAAGLVAILAGGWYYTRGEEQVVADTATDPLLGQIDTLTATIRGAAKRHNYVYPSPDNPSAPTSYMALLELESVPHELANQRGVELRGEIANELRELGDAFWERNPESKIASEFYAQALLFDPKDEIALERVGRDEAQMLALAEEAANLSFEMDELVGFEPLLVVSERNLILRRQRLERHRKRRAAAKARTELSEEVETLAQQPFALDPEQRTDAAAGAPVAIEAEVDTDGELVDETGEEVLEEEDPEAAANAAAEAAAAKKKAAALELKKASKADAKAGSAALASGDLATAESHFKSALEKNPRNAAAYDGLGRTYFNRGNFDRAIKNGLKAVQFAPRNGGYHLHLGDAYFKRGDTEDALEAYEAAVARASRSTESRAIEGLVGRRRRQTDPYPDENGGNQAPGHGQEPGQWEQLFDGGHHHHIAGHDTGEGPLTRVPAPTQAEQEGRDHGAVAGKAQLPQSEDRVWLGDGDAKSQQGQDHQKDPTDTHFRRLRHVRPTHSEHVAAQHRRERQHLRVKSRHHSGQDSRQGQALEPRTHVHSDQTRKDLV